MKKFLFLFLTVFSFVFFSILLNGCAQLTESSTESTISSAESTTTEAPETTTGSMAAFIGFSSEEEYESLKNMLNADLSETEWFTYWISSGISSAQEEPTMEEAKEMVALLEQTAHLFPCLPSSVWDEHYWEISFLSSHYLDGDPSFRLWYSVGDFKYVFRLFKVENIDNYLPSDLSSSPVLLNQKVGPYTVDFYTRPLASLTQLFGYYLIDNYVVTISSTDCQNASSVLDMIYFTGTPVTVTQEDISAYMQNEGSFRQGKYSFLVTDDGHFLVVESAGNDSQTVSRAERFTDFEAKPSDERFSQIEPDMTVFDVSGLVGMPLGEFTSGMISLDYESNTGERYRVYWKSDMTVQEVILISENK